MQYEILLISEQKLKSFTSINFNVDPNDLKPYVLQAQDLWLQSYLGSTFYDQLRDQVRTNTLNTANRDFLDNYVGQALCNYSLWKALPFLWSKIINKGLMISTSETATAVSTNDMKFLRQELLNTAESYMQKGIVFLTQRPGDYPAYIAPRIQDGDGVLPLRGRIFTNSFVTPKRPYKFNQNAGWGDSWNIENDCPDCYERNAPGGYTT